MMERTKQQIQQDYDDLKKRMEDTDKHHSEALDKIIKRNEEEMKRIQDQYNSSLDLMRFEK